MLCCFLLLVVVASLVFVVVDFPRPPLVSFVVVVSSWVFSLVVVVSPVVVEAVVLVPRGVVVVDAVPSPFIRVFLNIVVMVCCPTEPFTSPLVVVVVFLLLVVVVEVVPNACCCFVVVLSPLLSNSVWLGVSSGRFFVDCLLYFAIFSLMVANFSPIFRFSGAFCPPP